MTKSTGEWVAEVEVTVPGEKIWAFFQSTSIRLGYGHSPESAFKDLRSNMLKKEKAIGKPCLYWSERGDQRPFKGSPTKGLVKLTLGENI